MAKTVRERVAQPRGTRMRRRTHWGRCEACGKTGVVVTYCVVPRNAAPFVVADDVCGPPCLAKLVDATKLPGGLPQVSR
jgi:hypothetical protein